MLKNISERNINTKKIFMVKLYEIEFKTCFQLKYCIVPGRSTYHIQNYES
jgi:hypothetical protein